MKQYFVLVWGDYDGPTVNKFEDVHEMCAKAADIMESKRTKPYGQYILFAGSMLQEFRFEPKEVVTKYEAVEVE